MTSRVSALHRLAGRCSLSLHEKAGKGQVGQVIDPWFTITAASGHLIAVIQAMLESMPEQTIKSRLPFLIKAL